MAKGKFVQQIIEAAEKAGLDMSNAARMQRANDMGFDTSKTYYHGTKADFNEFDQKTKNDIGFHFGSKEQANDFVGDNGSIIPSYLSFKKTLELDFDPTIVDPDEYVVSGFNFYNEMTDRLLYEAGIERHNFMDEVRSGDKAANDLYDSMFGADKKIEKILSKDGADPRDVFNIKATKKYWSNMEKYLKSKGYDSIRYINELEGLSGKERYSTAVFDKNQIRSVNAAFDPSKNKSGNLLAGTIPAAVGLGSLLGGTEQAQAMPAPDFNARSAIQFAPQSQGSMQAPVNSRAALAAALAGQYNQLRRERVHPLLDALLPLGELPEDLWRKRAYGDDVNMRDYINAGIGML